MCLWSSAQNTSHHFENAYFEWKQEQSVFVHVSLNANELLFPAPFSRIELRLYRSYLRYCAKNICLVLIIMSIALNSCVLKPYQFKRLCAHIWRDGSLLIRQYTSTVVGGACKTWHHFLQILQMALSETLILIFGGIKKKRSRWICIIIWWLCTHTANTYLWPWSTKTVLSHWGIIVEIANNTLYGSKWSIFIFCQKSLGY